MFEGIKKHFCGDKNQPDQPVNQTSISQRISSIFRRKSQGEILLVQFLALTNCYDIGGATVRPFNIKYNPNRAYEMVKTSLRPKSGATSEADDSSWYLFKGSTKGLTEITLKRLAKEGKVKLVTRLQNQEGG